MAFALYKQLVRCPQCEYEGEAKLKGTGVIPWVLVIGMGGVGAFLFWPMLPVAALAGTVVMFAPAKQICPRCDWENVLKAPDPERKHNAVNLILLGILAAGVTAYALGAFDVLIEGASR